MFITILLSSMLFCSCNYQPTPSNNNQSEGSIVEPKDRDADYYISKGFQIFPQYKLAVKCPVKLTDISSKSKANFDFHYGGVENNETLYEIIVVNLPLGYYDLTVEEKIKLEQDFLTDKFPGKTVITEMAGKKINANVMEYSHKKGQGKGIAFILDGKTYAFNVISNNQVDKKFNSLTNNIIFYP